MSRSKAHIVHIHSYLFGTCPYLMTKRARPQIIHLQFGSAMCGAAQNMTWLVICRAVQGIGGGGIIQMVQITISDIVSLQE